MSQHQLWSRRSQGVDQAGVRHVTERAVVLDGLVAQQSTQDLAILLEILRRVTLKAVREHQFGKATSDPEDNAIAEALLQCGAHHRRDDRLPGARGQRGHT